MSHNHDTLLLISQGGGNQRDKGCPSNPQAYSYKTVTIGR